MKATTLLHKDHEEVKRLFTKLQDEKDPGDRKKIFEKIRQELTIHSDIEEKIFYPELRMTQVDEAEEEVLEALEEHQTVKVLLDELERLGTESPQFADKIEELRADVEQHVEEEEGEMFPEAIDLLGDDRLERIGTMLADRKESLKSGAPQGT